MQPSFQLKQVGGAYHAATVAAFATGLLGVSFSLAILVVIRLFFGPIEHEWLFLMIVGVGGFFTLLAGIDLYRTREREQLIKRIFAGVEVHRTGELVDGKPFLLHSKHRVHDLVNVDSVNFAVVLHEAIYSMTHSTTVSRPRTRYQFFESEILKVKFGRRRAPLI